MVERLGRWILKYFFLEFQELGSFWNFIPKDKKYLRYIDDAFLIYQCFKMKWNLTENLEKKMNRTNDKIHLLDRKKQKITSIPYQTEVIC